MLFDTRRGQWSSPTTACSALDETHQWCAAQQSIGNLLLCKANFACSQLIQQGASECVAATVLSRHSSLRARFVLLHGGLSPYEAKSMFVRLNVAPLRRFAKLTPREQEDSDVLQANELAALLHVDGASPAARHAHSILPMSDGTMCIVGGKDGQRLSAIYVRLWLPLSGAIDTVAVGDRCAALERTTAALECSVEVVAVLRLGGDGQAR